MAPPLNRAALILNLAAFLFVTVICLSTQAPIIQQEILKRCQDELLNHHLSLEGLAVDGRDVTLSGRPYDAVTSVRARRLLAQVRGVRVVKTRVLTVQSEAGGKAKQEPAPGSDGDAALTPGTIAEQNMIQDKIDAALRQRAITFKTDSAVLMPETGAVLDLIAASLAENPNVACEIRGYDSHPLEIRQGRELALQRALATEAYLASKGVGAWRLSAHAFRIGEGAGGRPADRVVDVVVKAR
jgi:outer membrane protein OmpA-like peptidoglycan-associated protein